MLRESEELIQKMKVYDNTIENTDVSATSPPSPPQQLDAKEQSDDAIRSEDDVNTTANTTTDGVAEEKIVVDARELHADVLISKIFLYVQEGKYSAAEKVCEETMSVTSELKNEGASVCIVYPPAHCEVCVSVWVS